MVKETTEKKFQNWCKRKGYYVRKILTDTGSGHQISQDADFIVANKKGVYLVECKENKTPYFSIDRFQQFNRLKLVMKKTNKIKCYLLLNYITNIILLDINTYNIYYNKLINNKLNINRSKSFKLQDFDKKHIYTWRTLRL